MNHDKIYTVTLVIPHAEKHQLNTEVTDFASVPQRVTDCIEALTKGTTLNVKRVEGVGQTTIKNANGDLFATITVQEHYIGAFSGHALRNKN